MKETFNRMIDAAGEICILGHISPDGDCVGSTLSVWNYITKRNPGKKVKVYLEECSGKFAYLNGFDGICHENCVDHSYDLCIVCDCGSTDRLGKFIKYLATAKESFLIDHHFTNSGFGSERIVVPEASSTCEIAYGLFEEEFITREVAECIYTGIIHDTGVFKYNTTSRKTMEIAGECMEKGVQFQHIIDNSFYSMTYKQRRLLGVVLENMEEKLDGKFFVSRLDQKTMQQYGILNSRDTDGYVDFIRNIDGAAGGAFFYQIPDGHYKASLRSNTDDLDVSRIATCFGGGGHKRAAGCILSADYRNDIEKIIAMAGEQLDRK